MAKGARYGSERAIFSDSRSGLRIIRLTHHATISMNLYFEMCSFTKDDRYVVVASQRGAGRDAPWDLMRIRTDGMEIVQLTDSDCLRGAVVSPAANAVFYQRGPELRKVDMLNLDETTVAETSGDPAQSGFSFGSIDASGRWYFGAYLDGQKRSRLFRADVQGGRVDVLHEAEMHGHIHANPTGTTVYFGSYINMDRPEISCTAFLVDADGKNLRPFSFKRFAHHSWFGSTGGFQGTLLPPGNALVTYKEGDADCVMLTEGRYYWHSGCSGDAQWIVSDTNWPQEGLYLLHAPSGTVSYVCDPKSSCSHPQWSHPHPALSPGVKFIVFNSDMTGIGQVYLVELTDEFLEQAAQGYVCRAGAL